MLDSDVKTEITIERKSRIRFPAVTICNYNQYKKSYFMTADNYKKALLVAMYPDLLQIGYSMVDLNQSAIPGYDATAVFKEAAHKIDNMTLRCVWQQEEQKCDEIFETVFTDMGVCYTFNADGGLHLSTAGSSHGLKVFLNLEYNDYFLSENLGLTGLKVKCRNDSNMGLRAN